MAASVFAFDWLRLPFRCNAFAPLAQETSKDLRILPFTLAAIRPSNETTTSRVESVAVIVANSLLPYTYDDSTTIGSMEVKPPGAYEELHFIDSIYTTRDELHDRLSNRGFKMLLEIEVPNVFCFMYIPKDFPETPEQMDLFDFSAIREAGERVPIGVCIGGTCLCNGWNEKTKLGLQGILKINCNCSAADKTATQIFMALDGFYREVECHGVNLNVNICGYSLGGLFAQVSTILLQDWANTTRNSVTCRTYESPGVPEMYHEISNNYSDDPETFWRQRISNYKSLPNPLNTVFEDVGKLYHLYNREHIKSDSKWIAKCVAGTTRRVMFWSGVARGFGITSCTKEFTTMDVLQQRTIIGAAIATELGMDLCEIVRCHHVGLMLGCFDAETGLPLTHACIEMQQWPLYDYFEETALKLFERSTRGLMPMDPRNAGIHTLLLFGGKKGYVQRKLTNLPGYRPLAAAKA